MDNNNSKDKIDRSGIFKNDQTAIDKVASLSTYSFDPASGELIWNHQEGGVFGDESISLRTIEDFENIIHPDDLKNFRKGMVAVKKKANFDLLYRIRRKNNDYVLVRDIGSYMFSGLKAKIVGFLWDVGEQKILQKQINSTNQKMLNILEDISDGFLAIDKDRRFSYINNRAAKMLRKDPEEMIGKKLEEIYPDILKPDNISVFAKEETGPVAFEKHYPDYNAWYYFRINPADEGWTVYIQDITKSKEAAIALEQSLQRLELAQHAGNIGTFEWDLLSDKIYWTPELEALYGLKPGTFYGTREHWRQFVHPDDLRDAVEKTEAGFREKKRDIELRFRIIKSDGAIRWLKSKGKLYPGPDGRLTKMVGINIDITDQMQYEEKIRYHIFNDGLTGLPNRLLFYEKIKEFLNTSPEKSASIIIIDLDMFKNINDSLGHSVGDRVIQEVALRFRSALKERGFLARLGGDEFVILLEGIGKEEQASIVARDVLESLKQPIIFDGKEFYSSASFGVSFYPQDGQDTSTLLKNADAALYRAKEQGRNNYQFYSPSMNSRSFQRLTLENSMRKALNDNEFLVYYQPQVDLKTGSIVQVEALVRWLHPELGLKLPDEFIEVAEGNGLIEPIGEWVLRTACQQMSEWNRMGLTMRLSVNMSARQFKRKHLVKTVRKILDETKFDPHKLELELTESVLVEDFGNTLNSMWELKRDGIQFSLDDFNTRYSSLNYIKRFPIDILKIDRCFVKGLPGNEKDAAIANSIITLAQTLNYSVVAEGVERLDQLQFLVSRGCGKAQGFLFSPPASAESIVGTLFTKDYREELNGKKKNP